MKVNGMFSIVRAGFVMPAPLVELSLKQFPNYLGTVYLDADDGLCVNYYDLKKDVDMTVDKFMDMQENFKDNLKGFWFAKADGPVPGDSMQPFVLLKREGGNAVVAFIAGDYSKWRSVDDDKEQTDDYHFVNGVLLPKLGKMFTKLCGEDTEKLFAELKGSEEDKTEEAALNAFAAHRGCIGLMFDHGDYLVFDTKNNDYRITGEWGYSTDRLGWNPNAKPKESVASKAKKAMFDVAHAVADTVSLTKKNSIDSANKEGDTAIPAAAETGSPDPLKFFPPKYLALQEKDGKIRLQCPKELTTKEDRWAWHDMWTVMVQGGDGQRHPQNGYKKVDNPPWAEANQDFLDWRAGKVKSLADLKKQPIKTTSSKPVREAPIISAEKRKTLAAYINSDAAKAKIEGGKILDPNDLKPGDKIALFTAQMAEYFPSIEDTFRMDEEYLSEIGKRDLNALVLLTMEYRRDLMSLLVSGDASPADTNDKDDTDDDKKEPVKADPPKGEKTKKKFAFA